MFSSSFYWSCKILLSVPNSNTKSLKRFSTAVFADLFVVPYVCAYLVSWSIITKMYSYPPVATSTLRKSIAIMSIDDVEVTVSNGACGVMCCFVKLDKGTYYRWKNWYLFPCFTSKLFTLLGVKIFLLQDVLCFCKILGKWAVSVIMV